MRILKKIVVVSGAALSLASAATAQSVVLRPSSGGRTQVAPGATLSVPLVIDMSAAGGLDIASLSSGLSWGSAVLALDSIRPAGFGSLTTNTSGATNGSATVSASGSSTTASVTMANAYFTALATGTNGRSTTLSVTPTAAANGQAIDLMSHLRVLDLDVCVAPPSKWGDANNDGTVNIIDAQQIARYAVGLGVVSAPVLLVQGDINSDNSIDIIDAQQIARFTVGLSAAARINNTSFAPPTAASITASTVRVAFAGAMVPGSSASLSGMATGDQAQIRPVVRDASNANVTSCATIAYTSSNPAVASVSSNGLIVAQGVGTTTISVSSGSQVATLNVTVPAFGGIAAKPGTALSVDPVGTVNPTTVPVFVARTAAGVATANVTVDLTMGGRCKFDLGRGVLKDTISLTTDVNGEVQPLVALPAGSNGAGCLIRASSTNTQFTHADSSLVAVYPAGTTHVWIGTTSTNWTTAANWVRPGSTPAAPVAATDQIFVPNFATLVNYPTLLIGALARGVAMDTGAVLVLNGNTLTVGTAGITGFGLFLNGGTTGGVHLATTGFVTGVFETLTIGQSGSCGSTAPMTGHLGVLSASTLNVYCRTVADSSVNTGNLNVFANFGEGRLTVPVNVAMGVGGNASIAGDQFTMSGFMFISGAATFGGNSITGGAAGSDGITVGGAATFNAATATYTNLTISVQGDVTIGGGSAGAQQFVGGSLLVGGNLAQLAGSVPGTYVTSADHYTQLHSLSTTLQTVTFASATANPLTTLDIQNTGAGVQFNSAVVIAQTAGSTGAGFTLTQGKLVIPSPLTFDVAGNIALSPSTTFTNNGTVTTTGTCAGRGQGATVNGTGTVNGVTMSTACP